MEKLLNTYKYILNEASIAKGLKEAKENVSQLERNKALELAFNCIDLTTLNATDTIKNGEKLALKVKEFDKNFPGKRNVAAICVYPPLVEKVSSLVGAMGIGVAAVGAGFPSSQTFLSVKLLECAEVVNRGATEVDIVISLGTWLEGKFDVVFDEIRKIKESIGEAHLKVILETGALISAEQIWNASIVSMEAGADFIKTSTGKMDPAATPEAAWVMCQAIKDFYEKTGKKIGFKPAGGIVTTDDALTYLSIVDSILGHDWLNNSLFRIGASRLANNILSELDNKSVSYF